MEVEAGRAYCGVPVAWCDARGVFILRSATALWHLSFPFRTLCASRTNGRTFAANDSQ